MILAPLVSRHAALLRLAIVVSAFLGIALAQGAQCQAGMPMGMAQSVVMLDSATGQCGAGVNDHGAHEDGHGHDSGMGVELPGAPMVMADDGEPAPPVGLVMACLAVFLALLAAFVFPRRGVVTAARRQVQDVGLTGVRAALPRAPTLAELCVLRT